MMRFNNKYEKLDADELIAKIDPNALPRHIAVIMDGNGRWANSRNFARIRGHRAGIKAVRRTITRCRELGIEYLTLFSFSSENWKRPKAEVSALMMLLKEYLTGERQELMEKQIRLKIIGRPDDLPDFVLKELDKTCNLTKDNTKMTLTLALSYGGRAEIVDAMNKIIAAGETEVTEDLIAQNLYAPDHPDPDLMIRTSGEARISNFLLWELAYTELYITDTLWPDFDERILNAAILDYQQRERRYGEVSTMVGGRK